MKRSRFIKKALNLGNLLICLVVGGILFLTIHTLEAVEQPSEYASLSQGKAEIPFGEGGMEQRISLDLRGIEVTDALKYLAERGGLNIVVSKNVAGRVTLLLSDVPIKDFFDIILRSNDLAYDEKEGVYYIMAEAEYRTLYGKRFSDMRKVKVFRLEYAIPEKAFNLIDMLKSDIGRVLIDEDSGTVVIMDTPANIREVERALNTLEQRSCIRVFDLKYAKAKEIEEQLKAQLDVKKVGFIKADLRSNQVTVQTFPERMQDVERIIQALDRKTRQVFIDARIVKIDLSDQMESGLEWEGLFRDLVTYTGATTFLGSHAYAPLYRSVAPAGTIGESFIDQYTEIEHSTRPPVGSKTVGSEKLYFGLVEKGNIEAVFKFLQTLGHTKILSHPRITVTEGQEATIHVGKTLKYVITTTTTGQTTTTTAEEVKEEDVGIILAVTPTINADGFVTMKVKPEVKSVVDYLTTPSGAEIPIIDKSTAETTVMVRDGATIIIGGLRKDESVMTCKKVPFLGDIPLLGNLFKSQTRTNTQTEIVVLITPTISSGEILETGKPKEFEARIKGYRGYLSYPGIED